MIQIGIIFQHITKNFNINNTSDINNMPMEMNDQLAGKREGIKDALSALSFHVPAI